MDDAEREYSHKVINDLFRFYRNSITRLVEKGCSEEEAVKKQGPYLENFFNLIRFMFPNPNPQGGTVYIRPSSPRFEKIRIETPQEPTIFKINEYLSVSFDGNNTKILVKNAKYPVCGLLTNRPYGPPPVDEITSIDEYASKHHHINPRTSKGLITPAEEFWGVCSNLQAWAELDYEPTLLHSNVSLYLLKSLIHAGDSKAKERLTEFVVNRFLLDSPLVVDSLMREYYINYIPREVKEILSKSKDFQNTEYSYLRWVEQGYIFCSTRRVVKKILNTTNEEYRVRWVKLLKSRCIDSDDTLDILIKYPKRRIVELLYANGALDKLRNDHLRELMLRTRSPCIFNFIFKELNFTVDFNVLLDALIETDKLKDFFCIPKDKEVLSKTERFISRLLHYQRMKKLEQQSEVDISHRGLNPKDLREEWRKFGETIKYNGEGGE